MTIDEVAKEKLISVEWSEITLEVQHLRAILDEIKSLKKKVANLEHSVRFKSEYNP